MKVKVCGIRNKKNLHFLESTEVDMIGFIFYEKSKRNFEDGELTPMDLDNCSKKKVGVFVNEELNKVVETVKKYEMDFVQLHGQESQEYCFNLKEKHISVIKAFSVYDQLPENIEAYDGVVDYFLFDTKGKNPGGNGVRFDWSVLSSYKLETPFILSGGIGPEDVGELKNLKNEKLAGVDVNSRFELEPALKDEQLLDAFIKDFKRN